MRLIHSQLAQHVHHMYRLILSKLVTTLKQPKWNFVRSVDEFFAKQENDPREHGFVGQKYGKKR